MRYTTIIAINELPVYDNIKARLVYLHLVLKSGYHDDDRDIVDIPLRKLANECGLTLSALRHALLQLQRAGLTEKIGTAWKVKKWLPPGKITKRKVMDNSGEARRQEAARIEERRRADKARIDEDKANKTSGFIKYYEAQVLKAKEGDIDAVHIVKVRRALYLQACEQSKHKPLEI